MMPRTPNRRSLSKTETTAEAATNVLPFPPVKTRGPLVGVPQYTKKAA